MFKNKHYDCSRQICLSKEDGLRYEDWQQKSDEISFFIHPKGFPVLLSPSEIQNCDEYSEGDPYTVDFNSEFHKLRADSTIQLLKSAIDFETSSPKMLDIGCGRGHLTAEFQKSFTNAEISGLDYSVSAISYAVDKFPGIDFIVANAYSPPYCENYFDVVVCNNLWEHVPDPLRLLEAIRKVLKTGGYLIISTPSRYRFENIINLIRGQPVAISRMHVTEYSVGQIVEQLRYGKFEVQKIYSKPIEFEIKTIKNFLLYKVIKPLIKMYLRAVNSRHDLEGTVFFLARKIKD